MRQATKVTLIIICCVVFTLLVLPIILVGNAEQTIQNEVNKKINAKVGWDDISLSLLKDFPNLQLDIRNLNIVGKEQFNQDTLLTINKVNLSADLFSYIFGNEASINKLGLETVRINAIAINDSIYNWDILLKEESIGKIDKSKDTNKNATKVLLSELSIKNTNIVYTNQANDLKLHLDELNIDMSSDRSSDKTKLNLNSSINNILIKQNGIKYLSDSQGEFHAIIETDLEGKRFVFRDNRLRINELDLGFDGGLTILENGYDLDLNLNSKETNIKQLLSLIPSKYLNDFERIETEGTMNLSSTLNGIYIHEKQLPQFSINLNVNDGVITHPNLNYAINEFYTQVNITNQSGQLDSTIFNVDSFHFKVANNPFDANFKLTTPISNATFKGKVDGIIDLEKVSFILPNQESKIRGELTTNLTFSGDLKTIEQENYDFINVDGDILLNQFTLDSKDFPKVLNIDNAHVNVSSKKIKLESLKCSMGKSDFSFTGILNNYLPYYFNDKILSGKLEHHSNSININEFIAKKLTTNVDSIPVKEPIEILTIPSNIDLRFSSSISSLTFDKLNISDAKGIITAKDSKLVLQQYQLKTLDGRVSMAGEYNTLNTKLPFLDFNFDAVGIDIKKMANSFSMVDSIMPVAKNASGKIASHFKLHSILNPDMSLNINSIKGGGNIKSNAITVSNSKVLNQMATLLQKDEYRTLKAEDIDIDYTMQNGKVIVSPFTTKIYGSDFRISGEQGFDQSLNYIIEAPVSRKDVANAMGFFGGIVNQNGDDVIVDVIIKGTADNPQMSLDLAKAQKQLQNEVSSDTQKAIEELLEDENVKKAVDDIKNRLGDFFK